MKGYKIPEGRVEGFKRWIEKYPKNMEYAWGMSAIVEALEIYPLEELDENPWHTGTPTEDGFYLIKYQCQIGKLKGKLTYRAVKRYKDELDGFIYEDGGINADDIWKPIEWQKIEEN